MSDLEFLFALLAAAAVLVRLADLIRVPYPIVLVLGGLAIGLVPGLPDIQLDPDVVFLVFLPPLLHSAGWRSSPKELWAERRPLGGLAVGLVLLTLGAVAVVAHAVVAGLSWPAAFVLGAILAPTDAVAAIATFARAHAPERVTLLAEGESMINDATALVAFRVALAAAVDGTFHPADAALDFVLTAVGGVAVGLAVGWVVQHLQRRLSDAPLSIFISLLTAYAGYIFAERLGVSGVLGAVVSGLYLGWHQHDAFDADTRLSAFAFWQVLVFGLNAALFVLLGLQFPTPTGELALDALLVTATVVAVRLAWTLLPATGAGDGVRERAVLGWSGMRGAISLAAALSVPRSVPERPALIAVTFGVILLTLVGQGLTLPPLLRALRLRADRVWSPDEAVARLEAAQSALDRLDELEEDGAAAEPVRRLRELYRARFRQCVAVLNAEGERPPELDDSYRSFSSLRRELIRAERTTLLDLRGDGRLRPDVLRLIERDLDLEEARLRA